MKIRDFRHSSRPINGFTLVELMVTLAILTLLLAIGVPSMQGFLASRQAQAQADTFASALRYARSEALKRSQTVTMCLTTTPDTVTPTCNAAGTDWNSGWLIFVGTTAVAPTVLPNLLLNVQQSIASTNTISAPRTSIAFTPDGLSVGATGSFEVTSHDGNHKSCVVLSNQGRVRMVKGACPSSSGSGA